MNVSILPWELDICIKRHEFQNFSLYRLYYWIEKMDQICSPNRSFRKNSPFNEKQAAFILTKYEQSKSIKEVQRKFRMEFYQKN